MVATSRGVTDKAGVFCLNGDGLFFVARSL